MNKYQNGKIYIIKSNTINDVYIGSTIQTLNQRLSGHKCHQNTLAKNILMYNDAIIELLELYPCNSKKELETKEQEYIKKYNNCINFILPVRTMKEWNYDNKEKNQKRIKQWKLDNKRICNYCEKELSYDGYNKHIQTCKKILNNNIDV